MDEKQMRVLIAIDDSECSQRVIEQAASGLYPKNSQFLVLHVIAVPSDKHWQDVGLGVDDEIKARLTLDGEKLVEDAVEFLRPQLAEGAEISGKIVEGHAAEQIIAAANEWDANHIMMGTHGRGALGKLVMGSVAQEVLKKAPCTVEVVGAPKAEEKPKPKKMHVLY